MPSVVKRRPSAALVVALLALFLAAGGPAEAARLITGKNVKDRSLGTRDLSRKAVEDLRRTPRGSVGERALGDRAVSGAKVADGSLDSRDVARFSGRFRVPLQQVAANSCWSGEPIGLAPEQAGADISADLVIVTPDERWPERSLSFTVRNSANRSRFVLAGCNPTTQATQPVEVGFRYAVIDLP